MPCNSHQFNLSIKKIAFFALAFIGCLNLNGQSISSRFAGIVNTLDSLNKTHPIEKVHLHLDKPFYSLGDTIWIKGYITGAENKLSDLSIILHLDLINSANAVKGSLNLPVTNGEAWGALVLSDSVFSAEDHHLRAYTNIMRNFNEDYFYYRTIAIGNALPIALRNASKADTLINQFTAAQPLIKSTDDITLSFFPEGGNLINGLPTTIAFKALGSDGFSREVSGYVVDQNGKQVANFASEHAGMGVFKMTPDAASVYQAVIKINGTDKRIAMPPIQDKGYALSVTQDDNNVIVRLISSADLPNDTLNIVAQANNHVYYTGQAFVIGRRFLGALPKNRFPAGVLQITLLSKTFEPLAERLVFIKNGTQNVTININNPLANSQSRLNIVAADALTQPVTGTFSIAITDADKVAYSEDDEVSIFSDLLLTSDLSGYIEQPNYYFADTLSIKQKHLDNLMLTQGWRRFIWQDVLANKMPPATFKPENGNISGIVLDAKKQPVAGARLSLLFKTNGLSVFNTLSGADGKFVFNGVLADKNEKYALTASDRTGNKNYLVELYQQQEINPPTGFYRPALPYPGFSNYITNAKQEYDGLINSGFFNGGNLLKEVVIKDAKKPTANYAAVQHSKNLHGPGNADYVLTFLDLARCNGAIDLSGCLINIGKYNGITFNNGLLYSRGRREPMGVYVDGNYVGTSYDGAINDISSIEVLNSVALTSIYGSMGGNGLILITTKTGDIDYNSYEMERFGKVTVTAKKPKTPINNLTIAPRREFYVPKYVPLQNNTPIARSTVYWKPDVKTDATGKAFIEFFSGDAPRDYRVIIEGVGAQGQIGRKVFNYSLK